MQYSSFSNIKNQAGWTFWSIFFVLSVILFFAYVGMQLVPVYTTNSGVINAMERSLDNQDLAKMTRRTVIRKVDSQLFLDENHLLLNYKTDLKVRRSRREFIVETHYKREIPLFFNLSLVASFDNIVKRPLDSGY